ncbi:MAG TPA: hypothetical protein HPP94_02410 [Desulfuromonadales bacterium]|nr:hypothetical protein [Desulfuromonadales bacterium]
MVFSLRRLQVISLVLGFSLLLLLSGCAASSTTIVDEEVVTNPKPMYTYKSLLIRDFELKRDLYSDAGSEKLSSREHRYSQIPGELSGHIERYVRSRRTYHTISRDAKPDATTLVVTGRFTRVGRFKISVVVTLLDGASGQEVAYFRQTLWDVLDTTEAISGLGREVADFIDRIQYK